MKRQFDLTLIGQMYLHTKMLRRLIVLCLLFIGCSLLARGTDKHCVKGSVPSIQSPNTSDPAYTSAEGNYLPTGECTWYARGRAKELNPSLQLPIHLGNAESWYTNAGFANFGKSNAIPNAPAFAVWGGGNSGVGHVAYVERVEGNVIYLTEANFDTYTGKNAATGGGWDPCVKEFTFDSSDFQNHGGHFEGFIYLNVSTGSNGSGPVVSPPAGISAVSSVTLKSMSPSTHSAGQFTVDLYGSGFQQGAKVFAQGTGWSSDRPPVTVIDGSHLQTIIVAESPGTFTIAVRNPDGTLSGALPIQITAATPGSSAGSGVVPSLQSVSPTSHVAGQFQVDLYGSGFQQGARVVAQGDTWSSDQAAVMYLAPNHLRAIIVANNAARFTLAVRNPDGQLSTTQPFEVTGGQSVVTIAPTKAAQPSQPSTQALPPAAATPTGSSNTFGQATQPAASSPAPVGSAPQPASVSGGQSVQSPIKPNANSTNTGATSTANQSSGRSPSTSAAQPPIRDSHTPIQPIQVQSIPANQPVSTTPTNVPGIRLPSQPGPSSSYTSGGATAIKTGNTQPAANSSRNPQTTIGNSTATKTKSSTGTSPVVVNPNTQSSQKTSQTSISPRGGPQNATTLQPVPNLPAAHPNSTPVNQNAVSKTTVPPQGPSPSVPTSPVHNSQSNYPVPTNQKTVSTTTTPVRGPAPPPTPSKPPTTQSQPPSQTSANKSSSQPANTTQNTTQKPSDKKKP